jgi:hypothetical protein
MDFPSSKSKAKKGESEGGKKTFAVLQIVSTQIFFIALAGFAFISIIFHFETLPPPSGKKSSFFCRKVCALDRK